MKRGFIFTFDLILIASLFIALFSVPIYYYKKPSFDISYAQSDITVSYLLNKKDKPAQGDSYICYKVIKNKIDSLEEKNYCYSGYYESYKNE